MEIIAKFDPSALTTGEFPLSELSNGIGTIILWNESNWTLDITFPNGMTDIAPAWTASIFEPQGPQGQVTWVQDTQLDLISPPISKVWVIAYAENEHIAGTFPCALVRQMGVGNIVSTSGGSTVNIVDDGRPVGSQTIEATASGDPSSGVTLSNTGNLILGNALHHGSISSDHGQFYTDGNGNLVLTSLASAVANESISVNNFGNTTNSQGVTSIPVTLGIPANQAINLGIGFHLPTGVGGVFLQAWFDGIFNMLCGQGFSSQLIDTFNGTTGTMNMCQPFVAPGLQFGWARWSGYSTTVRNDYGLAKKVDNSAYFFIGETQGGSVSFLSSSSPVTCSTVNTVAATGGSQSPETLLKQFTQGMVRGEFDSIGFNFASAASGFLFYVGC